MKKIRNIFKDKSWITIPNGLTILRIILIPFIVFGISKQAWYYVFILLMVSSITDFFDGYIARALHQETYLGRVLDPLADKIFIISIFTSLAFINSPSFWIPKWFVVLVLTRELVIVLGSLFIIETKVKFEIHPTIWGKLTTFFQFMFIAWLFILNFFGWLPTKTYFILLIILSVFSLISFFQYAKIGISYLFNKK